MKSRNGSQQRIVPLNCTPQPVSEVSLFRVRSCRYMLRTTAEARIWFERSLPQAYWT